MHIKSQNFTIIKAIGEKQKPIKNKRYIQIKNEKKKKRTHTHIAFN